MAGHQGRHDQCGLQASSVPVSKGYKCGEIGQSGGKGLRACS